MDNDMYNMITSARAIVARYDKGIAFDGDGAEEALVRLLAAYTPPPPPVSEEQSAREDYWATVEGIAKDALEAWKDSDWDDDALNTYVHESVDRNGYIIYTRKTLQVLSFTDNDGAWEDLGLDSSKGWESVIQQIAYCAMEQDVWDKIHESKDDYRAQHEPEKEEEEAQAAQEAQAAVAAYEEEEEEEALAVFMHRARDSWYRTNLSDGPWINVWVAATRNDALRAALLEEYGSFHTLD